MLAVRHFGGIYFTSLALHIPSDPGGWGLHGGWTQTHTHTHTHTHIIIAIRFTSLRWKRNFLKHQNIMTAIVGYVTQV